MATRQITHEEPHEIDADFEDRTDETAAEKQTTDDIAAELGVSDNIADFDLKVYRTPPTGKTLVWLFDVSGVTVTGLAQRLRDEYGNGNYQIWLFKNSKLKRRIPLSVEVPRAAPAAQATAADSALMASVQQQGQALTTVLQTLAELKASPPVVAPASPFAGMDLPAIITAVAGAATAFKALMPPPPPVQNPMELFLGALEFARDMQEGGKEKGISGMISDVLQSPLLERVLQNAQATQGQPQQPQQPQRLAPPAPPPQQPRQPAAPPQPQQPPATPSPDDTAQQFIAYVQALTIRASKNGDPVLAADMIEEDIPANELAMLLGMPDPVAALAQYVPAVANYRPWFEEVFSALTEESDEGQMQTARDNGTVGEDLAANVIDAAPTPFHADGASAGGGGRAPNAQGNVGSGEGG